MDRNPYAATVLPNPLDNDSAGEVAAGIDAHDLIPEWEKRRLWFNAILIAETLLLLLIQPARITDSQLWQVIIEGAIAANICFCAGPIGNWYLARLGATRRAAGVVLFALGTLLAMLLAFAAMMITWIP